MIIKRDTYAIFHTRESDGEDICIMDDVGRTALIPVSSLEDILEDIVLFANQRWETASVSTKFGDL
jgi:hypothetical protein